MRKIKIKRQLSLIVLFFFIFSIIPNMPFIGTKIAKATGTTDISASGTQPNYQIGGGDVYVDPNLTVSSDTNLDGAKVYFTDGFVSGQDSLVFTNQLGITGSYSPTSGVLSLSGSTTAANYQTALRSVKYHNNSGSATAGTRKIVVSLGQSTLCFAVTGHYYEYVSSPGITWSAAKTAAEAKSFSGLHGYLATITTAEENAFVASKCAGDGWIGATDADPASIATSGNREWYWRTGPEAGTHLITQVSTWNSGGVQTAYAYQNFATGEPNDWSSTTPNSSPNGENCAHMYSSTGTWNDYAYNNTSILGYLVEYGGGSFGDPSTIHTSITKTLLVSAGNLVTSTQYTVDNGANIITNIPVIVDYTNFLSNVTVASGYTSAVYQSDGSTPVTSGTIKTGMKLKVYLSGALQKAFTLINAAEIFPDEIVVPGTNTDLAGDDVVTNSLPLGFNFNYFNSPYSSGFINSNGLLLFGTGDGSFTNVSMPTAAPPNNMICAFWDDLVPGNGSPSLAKPTILYTTVGNAPNRKFIAQWTNMYFYNTTVQLGTFQAILYEGSNDIQIQYRELMGSDRAFGSSATVGIEDSNGVNGNKYMYSNVETSPFSFPDEYQGNKLHSRQAIRFTPSGSSYTMNSNATYDPIFVLDSNLPGMPVLTSPSSGGFGVSTSVTFTWQSGGNTTGYKLMYADNANFTNPTIIDNITDTSKTVSLTEGANYYWKVIALNANGQTVSSPRSFITGSAGSPQMTAIQNQTVARNASTGALSFTISDPDTDVYNVTVSASSSYQSLIPNGNISFGGTGANRTITVVPASNVSGTANITLTLNDGSNISVSTFTVKVNDPPTISDISDIGVSQAGNTGAISFTVGDSETNVNNLLLSATSSNQSIVRDGDITFGGSGANRTITVNTLNVSGSATITVKVTDEGARVATDTFTVSTINPPTVNSFTKTAYSDNTVTFTAGDFTGSVPLSKIQITSLPLPANGKLKLSGSDITLNGEIAAADLPNITFVPNTNWEGSTSFTWKGSNGTAYSVSAATTTINLRKMITSTQYIVDNAAGIIFNVPANVSYDTFMGNLIKDTVVTAELYKSDGTTLVNSGSITAGMKLKATGTGGVTKWYNVRTAADFYPDEIVIPGENTGMWYDDTNTGALDLGFNFNYYGTNYSKGYISTNGLLSFGNGYREWTNYNIPNSYTPNNMICAFWDDLVVQNYNNSQTARKTILYKTIGTAPNRKFIAQWTNMYFYSNPSLPMGTFQAILYEGSNKVQIQYRELMGSNLSFGSSATIGLENSSGSAGVKYSYNTQSLYTHKAISFTPNGNTYTMNSDTEYDPIFLIDTNLPGMPVLTSPSNGGAGVSTPVTFTWNGGANTNNYRLIVSTNANFSTLVIDQTVTTTTYTSTANALNAGTTYYWKVIGNNSQGSTASGPRSFETGSSGAPTITSIANQTVARNTPTGALSFTIGDNDTAIGNLSVITGSSNTTVIPAGNIVIGGTAADRTVTVTPASDVSGSSTITLAVSDGTSVSTSTFVVKVNNPPTISNIADTTVAAGGNTGAIPFTIGDTETALANNLIVSASSSNTALVPNSSIVFGGSDTNRTITVTPVNTGRIGSATITVTVSDADAGTGTDTFVVTVGNNPPRVASTTKNGTEDITMAFAEADFTSAYTDDEHNEFSRVKITALPNAAAGVLNYNGTAVALNQEVSKADLSKLTFVPKDNWNGNASFGWQANDGSSYSVAATMTLNIAPVNDAPSVRDGSKIGNEDGILSFGLADFTHCYTDQEGTALRQIKIETVPNSATEGVLKVNGANVLQGMVVQAADIPNMTFVPNVGFNGSTQFTWKGNDGTDFSATAGTMTITINHVNHAPTAGNIVKNGTEDTDITFTQANFTDNFRDTDAGDTLNSIRIETLPSNGTLKLLDAAVTEGQTIIAADLGNLKFVPNANWNGTASFSYKAYDGAASEPAYSVAATVTMNVAAVNDAPVITDGSLNVNEDSSLTNIAFGGSFTDVDGTLSQVMITALPTHGLLKLNGNTLLVGSVVYQSSLSNIIYLPNTLYYGSDSFKWKGSDGAAYSNEGTFSITVAHVNHAPFVVNSIVSTNEDTAYTGTLSSSDADTGDAKTYTVVTNGLKGTVLITNAVTGAFTYTPNVNANGTDTFTFRVNDGSVNSNTATVTVNIQSVNDAPVVSNIVDKTISEDTALNFTAEDFSTHFTDVDGDSLSRMKITVAPANGKLRLGGVEVTVNDEILTSQLGQLKFVPNANWNGSTSFKWKGCDGTVYSDNESTVSIEATPVNDAPEVSNVSIAGIEDTPVTFSSISFNGNYSDVENDSLQKIQITSLPSLGTLYKGHTSDTTGTAISTGDEITVDELGTLAYIPQTNYHSVEMFNWRAYDGTAWSVNEATVSMNIAAANDKPTIVAISKAAYEDNNVNFADSDFNVAGVFNEVDTLDNAPQESRTMASLQVTTLPQYGILKLGETDVTLNQVIASSDIAALKFVPDSNWNGSTSFNWRAFDGLEWSEAASAVNITINPVNDAPVVDNVSISTNEDTTCSGILLGTDVDRNSLTYSLGDGSTTKATDHGTVTINIDGTYTYTPTANFNGQDTFTYKVNDTTVDSNTATVTIIVNPVNDAPTIVDSTKAGNEDSNVNFVASDFAINDVDGTTTSSIKIVSLPTNGILKVGDRNINAGDIISSAELGTVTYNPNLLWPATGTVSDSFTWQGSDGEAYSNTATVSLNITHVNHLPAAYNGSVEATEDTQAAGTLTSSDVDTADTADTMTYSIVANGAKGTATITNTTTGAFTYTPTADANGTDTFTFKVNDGQGDSNTATITVYIAAVNDAPTVSDFAVNKDNDRELALTANDFTAHFTDVDSTTMSSIMITEVTTHGTLKLNDRDINDRDIINAEDIPSISYVPQAFYNGNDTFKWQGGDGLLYSTTSAAVTITVNQANHAPTVSGFTSNAIEDTDYIFGSAEFTNNFADVDTGDAAKNTLLKIKITALPQHGKLYDGATEITAVNSEIVDLTTIKYVPTANYNGQDSFTWMGFDGADYSDAGAIVTLNLAPVNDKPVTNESSVSGTEDTEYTFAADNFNFTDIDGDSLSQIIITSLPSNGNLKLGEDIVNVNSVVTSGGISLLNFIPDENWNGSTSFNFKVNDGSENSDNAAEMTINIAAVNDAPVVSGLNVSFNQDSTFTFNADDFNRKFMDYEGSSMTKIKIASLPSNGTLKYNNSAVSVGTEIPVASIGNLVFTADDNWYGNTWFTWNGFDGELYANANARANVEVVHVNGAPTSVESTINCIKNVAYTFSSQDFLISDRDGDSVSSIQILSLPSHGILRLGVAEVTTNQSISLADFANLIYTPANNYTGNDSFNWKGNDGNVYSSNNVANTLNIVISSTEAVSLDKASVSITYVAGDNENSVTQNITLSGNAGANGSRITWSSSNPQFITNSGLVTRPEYSDGDKTVTMTATITKGGIVDTKVFNLTVKKKLSQNADLSNIVFDKGELSPAFTAGNTTYYNVIDSNESTVKLIATAKDSATATITINNAAIASGVQTGDIDINTNNVISIVVTAENGTKKTYKVVVLKQNYVSLKYDDFSKDTNLIKLNNDAKITNNALVLTPNLTWKKGSAFYTNRVSLANERSFSTNFSFKMSGRGGAGQADGIVFTLQTVSNTAGSVGGGIGYLGLTPSIGVEFDNWVNRENRDPAGPHIGIDINGSVVSKATVLTAPFDIRDGSVYYAWIDYDGPNKTMSVRFSNTNVRPVNAVLTQTNLDLKSILNMDEVYAGFTSATGGASQEHSIQNWYFNNDLNPIDLSKYAYTETPVTVNLTPTPANNTTSSTIKAVVLNKDGSKAVNIPVTFSTTRGTLSSTVEVTDSNGEVTVTLNSAIASESATVKAVAKGGAYGTVTIANLNLTDTDSVAADKESLEIGYAAGDNALSVTQNAIFKTTGTNGTTISWSSDSLSNVGNNGTVTRPNYFDGDKVVTLTATITKNGESAQKTFTVNVKKLPYVAPVLGVASDTLNESPANDGSISGTKVVNIANATFANDISANDITINNLPVGLGYTVTRNSDNQIAISFTGKAVEHALNNSTNNMSIKVNESKISRTLSDITSGSFGISFRNPVTVSATDSEVDEPSPYTSGTIEGGIRVNLTNGTFANNINSEDITVSNIPEGLQPSVTRDSDTQITVSFIGNAVANENVNDVNNATIIISKSAVIGASINPITNTFKINFNEPEPTLTIGTATLNEAAANDGSVIGTQVITLNHGSFTGLVASDITVNGLPSGITGNVTIDSDTQITVSFTGNASNHRLTDSVGNITVEVPQGKITPNQAGVTLSAPVDSNTFGIQFMNPYATINVSNANINEADAKDGSISATQVINIVDGTFAEGISSDYVTVNNLPEGLGITVERTSPTQLTIHFTGKAISQNTAAQNASITIAKSKIIGAPNSLTTDSFAINAPTNEALALWDKNLLDIIYQAGDSSSSITGNVGLRTSGDNGTIISWSSNNTAVIGNDGTVTRPSFISGDTTVRLTATINKNGAIETKTFDVVVIKAPITDSERVLLDKNSLEIGYMDGDSSTNVTQNLYLEESMENGSTVTWSSSDLSVVSIDGTVTRPSYTVGDKTVTLTATITKGGVTETKTFVVTVTKSPITNAESVQLDKAIVDVQYAAGDSAANVNSNLTLLGTPANGTTITWSSTDAGIVSTNGTVTRPSYTVGDKTVTLTATITKGDVTETKTFELTIKKLPITNAESVQLDKATVDVQYAAGDSAANVNSNLTLLGTPANGTTIAWSSTDAGIVSTNGTVTRPSYTVGDKTVTLTATITKGDVTETKTFVVTIKKLPAPPSGGATVPTPPTPTEPTVIGTPEDNTKLEGIIETIVKEEIKDKTGTTGATTVTQEKQQQMVTEVKETVKKSLQDIEVKAVETEANSKTGGVQVNLGSDIFDVGDEIKNIVSKGLNQGNTSSTEDGIEYQLNMRLVETETENVVYKKEKISKEESAINVNELKDYTWYTVKVDIVVNNKVVGTREKKILTPDRTPPVIKEVVIKKRRSNQ